MCTLKVQAFIYNYNETENERLFLLYCSKPSKPCFLLVAASLCDYGGFVIISSFKLLLPVFCHCWHHAHNTQRGD